MSSNAKSNFEVSRQNLENYIASNTFSNHQTYNETCDQTLNFQGENFFEQNEGEKGNFGEDQGHCLIESSKMYTTNLTIMDSDYEFNFIENYNNGEDYHNLYKEKLKSPRLEKFNTKYYQNSESFSSSLLNSPKKSHPNSLNSNLSMMIGLMSNQDHEQIKTHGNNFIQNVNIHTISNHHKHKKDESKSIMNPIMEVHEDPERQNNSLSELSDYHSSLNQAYLWITQDSQDQTNEITQYSIFRDAYAHVNYGEASTIDHNNNHNLEDDNNILNLLGMTEVCHVSDL